MGVWTFLGGLAGILRMLVAAALVAVSLIVYFTFWVIPDRVEAAKIGYVLLSRATAAEASVEELKKQIKSQTVVIDAYQVQYKNSLAQLTQQDADAEARIAEYEQQAKQKREVQGPPAPGVVAPSDDLTSDEYNFLVRQRQSRQAGGAKR